MKRGILEKLEIAAAASVCSALLGLLSYLTLRRAASLPLGAGGLIMLLAAMGLLGHRNAGSDRFPKWKARFPHTSITAAVLTASIVLLAAGCLMDYFAR